MKEEYTIARYVKKYELDIEKMINDFKKYISTIIENNSRGYLSYEDKEEIISDVFLTIWHNKVKIDNTKPLKNYIAGITKNLVKDKLKKQNCKYNEIELIDNKIIDLSNIELICENNQIMEVIQKELNNMKKGDYQIFSKYYYLSKNVKEIAKELNMSETNVKVRLYRIRKKLKLKLENKGYYYKILTIILVLCMITGTVFAKNIMNFIKALFENVSEGVNRAIQSGYIDNVEMDYSKSQEADIKVDSILMDDYNLDILFNIKLKENEISTEIVNFEIPDLFISDDMNNIIVAKFENNISYEEFCKERGLNIEYKNIAYGDGSESGIIINKENNIYKYSYVTHSTEFPKSRRLIIEFNRIIALDKQKNTIKEILGEWKIEINLPNEFYNRETIIYNMKSCNDENLKLTRATVSKTSMKIELETKWGNSIYNKEDSKEIQQKKIDNWLNNQNISGANLLIKNEYIKNGNERMFYPSKSSDGEGGYGQKADGTLIYYQTFDLTTFDITDEMVVILPLGGELLEKRAEKEIVIELVRKIE